MFQVDSVIDIKDLFAEVIRKAWIIIICMIVFAVAFGGYKYIDVMKTQQDVNSGTIELTKEEKEVALEYVAMVQKYENLEEYCANSILFTFNPYNVYQTELQYIIGGNVKADDVATIRAAYADYVIFGRLASDIAENNPKYDEIAVRDIIETDSEIREQEETLKTVRIMIYAKNPKQSKALVNCVKEQMEAYSEEIKQTIAVHEFKLLDEDTISTIRVDFEDTKNYYEDRLTALEDKKEFFEGKLNSLQMKYALNLLGEEIEDIEAGVEEKISLKAILIFVIFGSIIGAALGVVMIIAWYFFSDKIKTAKEIEQMYQITYFGNCSLNKRTTFDKLADKFFHKNQNFNTQENMITIASNIISFYDRKTKEKIYLVGKADKKMKGILEKISSELKKEMIDVVFSENIKDIYASSENIKLPKNIIQVVKIRTTTVQEINDEIEFCRKQNLKICGYITFSK